MPTRAAPGLARRTIGRSIAAARLLALLVVACWLMLVDPASWPKPGLGADWLSRTSLGQILRDDPAVQQPVLHGYDTAGIAGAIAGDISLVSSFNGYTVTIIGDLTAVGSFSVGSSGQTSNALSNTGNHNLTFKGNVAIPDVTYTAGTGTITLDNTAAQAINFNGQTVEAVVVSDASTGAITLGANFTTPYVHDCNSLIDLNGFTITETGTDPSPCSSNTYFFPANFGGRL